MKKTDFFITKTISPGESSAPVTNYCINGSPFITVRHNMNGALAKVYIAILDRYKDIENMARQWDEVAYLMTYAYPMEKKLKAIEIMRQVAMNGYNVNDFNELKSSSRQDNLANCRQLLFFIEHKLFGFTCMKVGKSYNRDHATVVYNVKKFAQSFHHLDKFFDINVNIISILTNELLPEVKESFDCLKKELEESK